MTDKEKIRNIIELFIAWNGETEVIDVANLDSAIDFIADSLQEEPVSEETMTIRKEWFEHCKKSWYNEGYIDGKYNRKSQFEKPVSKGLDYYGLNSMPEAALAKETRESWNDRLNEKEK